MPNSFQNRGLTHIGQTLSRITNPALRKRGFAHKETLGRWATIVGDNLADFSTPQRIAYPARQGGQGVLQIRVDSVRALEIQHMSSIIIERINTYFGYRAVNSLRIVQDPISFRKKNKAAIGQPSKRTLPSSNNTQIPFTSDPGLRRALEGLDRCLQADKQRLRDAQ